MRAVHITQRGEPAEAIEVVEVETPKPGPSEVRLEVQACALNHLDIFARTGHPENEDNFPKRTGGDIAGVVDAVGMDVTDIAEGDEVVVYPGTICGACEYCLNGEHTMCPDYRIIGEELPGGLAEYMTVPVWCLDSKPDNLDFETAAAWPVTFTTAWRMLITTGDLRPSERALILGASGGVGNAALQLAERITTIVYATTSSTEKAEQISQWADEVIDYTKVPFDEAIMDLTDDRGVDLVVDHIGQETWQKSINSLAMDGRMVICGATSGPSPDINIRSIYQHHRQIRGAPMGNRQDFRDVGRLIAHGEVTPVIDRVLPLAETAKGHRVIEDREVFGKIIIKPQE